MLVVPGPGAAIKARMQNVPGAQKHPGRRQTPSRIWD